MELAPSNTVVTQPGRLHDCSGLCIQSSVLQMQMLNSMVSLCTPWKGTLMKPWQAVTAAWRIFRALCVHEQAGVRVQGVVLVPLLSL